MMRGKGGWHKSMCFHICPWCFFKPSLSFWCSCFPLGQCMALKDLAHSLHLPCFWPSPKYSIIQGTAPAAPCSMCWGSMISDGCFTALLFHPSVLWSRSVTSILQQLLPLTNPLPSTLQPSFLLPCNRDFYLRFYRVTNIRGLHLTISNWTHSPESMLKAPFWGRCKKISINSSYLSVIHVVVCCTKL